MFYLFRCFRHSKRLCGVKFIMLRESNKQGAGKCSKILLISELLPINSFFIILCSKIRLGLYMDGPKWLHSSQSLIYNNKKSKLDIFSLKTNWA